jgi:hypothetical protein
MVEYSRDHYHETPKIRRQLEEYDLDIFETTIRCGIDQAYERQIDDSKKTNQKTRSETVNESYLTSWSKKKKRKFISTNRKIKERRTNKVNNES